MKLPTGTKMSQIDKITTEEYFIPSAVLMENAGIYVCQKMICDFPDILSSAPFIIAGPGNNGGDGFVISRQLLVRGAASFCLLLGDYKKLKGDAKTNFDILLRLSKENSGLFVAVAEDEKKWDEYKEVIFCSPYLIDALFGTGIKEEAKGLYGKVICDINSLYKGRVLSVDVPSGLISDASSYQTDSVIRAYKTYAIGCPKLGMADYPGKLYCGKTEIIDIGFPESLLRSPDIKTNLFMQDDAKKIKPERKEYSNKGDYGHLLVIAGSADYKGAAGLCSKAAFAAGAGLVTLASTEGVCQSLLAKENHIITRSLGECGSLKAKHFDLIKDSLDKYNACLIGPGLGMEKGTREFVKEFLINYKGVCIADADCLNIVSEDIGILKKACCKKLILTPHMEEFSRLIKKPVDQILKDKLSYALDFADKHDVVLVLKDAVTLTVYGGQAFYNTTGNKGLSRGGSGDVLAGVIGGLAARGLRELDASLFGVFLCGKTADILTAERGFEGVSPSLMIENLYRGFKEIDR